MKPYVSAAMGPALALEVEGHGNYPWLRHYHGGGEARTMTAFGGRIGAGVDFQISNWLVLGADMAYHVTSDFSQLLDGHRNGNGLTFAFQVGVNLGRRMPDRSSR